MDYGSNFDLLWKILLWAPPIILAVTVHEMGHGWMAKQLGDPTAANLGRLTPNPLKHIDPVGTLLLPALLIITKAGFVFGWAKPVPIDWRNLRHRRRDMALVALAGPGANGLQLLFWVGVIWLAYAVSPAAPALRQSLISMGEVGIISNIALVAFNLIPLPPLDGSRVVTAVLPPKLAFYYNRLEPFGLVIIMLLLVLGWMDELVGPLLLVGERLAYALLPVP
ncbi:MAG: site-2 protease family protein [Chromatiales bacterium]